MRDFLELAVLVTFVVTVTGLLLAGVIHVAVPSITRPARDEASTSATSAAYST